MHFKVFLSTYFLIRERAFNISRVRRSKDKERYKKSKGRKRGRESDKKRGIEREIDKKGGMGERNIHISRYTYIYIFAGCPQHNRFSFFTLFKL